ncbi:vWA domain-containing protein [Hyphomonas jannaschiana]|uniref:von Willebrand factor A n=1 Tax=Hyphomonas jannaschiana VP2 TaxID=1280952 RepID=A0A059F9U6_9PROT|nr:VWA domain-containing protein [Hyphomonas jannaschiana]KCZ87372.1 von Willebrand factor A [Hyphomonas jannaschiana VP2]
MRNKTLGLVMASVAAAALLTGCANETGGSTTEIAQTPPPPAPPPPPPATVQAEQRVAMSGAMKAGDYAAAMPPPPAIMAAPEPEFRDKYEDVDPNPVKLVSEEPVSTFSIDVDTASYANVRRFLKSGVLPPKDAVRIEEMINYFDYTYPQPEAGADPFATYVTLAPSPFAEGRQLMQIGIQGRDIDRDARPPVNLTLLVDVSGSMHSEDKLPLAKQALKLMLDQMDPQDTISIAVYAGAAGEVLEPTPVSEKRKIYAALENLRAGGSTAGGEGLRLAYSLAEQGLKKDAVNRVMLLTDGDFNVGITDSEQLEDFISRKRESGIYLSVLGFGRGNYNDALMQKIAQTGNGTAAYVDTLSEARKVLADDLGGNLFPIADDVKIQVEFNPARVAEYRLIGYETRMLDRADFNNDKVDAGDIGAGASVTAIYDITPVGSDAAQIDPLRYGDAANASDRKSGEYAFVKLRYKPPGEPDSILLTHAVTDADKADSLDAAPQWVRFATAVAGFGEMLRGGEDLGAGFGWEEIRNLAAGAKGEDEFGYRAEFIELSRLAETAEAQAALNRPAPEQ